MSIQGKFSLIETALELAQFLDKASEKAISKELSEVVNLHAKIAAASIWIPVPGVAIAVAFANTWKMYARINKVAGISFSENLLKSIAAGIGATLFSNLLSIGVAETIKAVIPGLGTVFTGLTMSASIYTSVIVAGVVYMKALTALLKQKSELTDANLQQAVDSIVNDKSQIQEILDAHKKHQDFKGSRETDSL